MSQRAPSQPSAPLGQAERKRWNFGCLQRALGHEVAAEVQQRRGGSGECSQGCGGGQSCGATGPPPVTAPPTGADVPHLTPAQQSQGGGLSPSGTCPCARVLSETAAPPGSLSLPGMACLPSASASITASAAAGTAPCTAPCTAPGTATGTACSGACSGPGHQREGSNSGRRPSSVSEEPILAAHPLHIASSYHRVLGKPSPGNRNPADWVMSASAPGIS